MSKIAEPYLLPCPRYLKIISGNFVLPKNDLAKCFQIRQAHLAPKKSEGYALIIDQNGIKISHHDGGGLRAAFATLRQLQRIYGKHLPYLKIRDWPDFSRRGVMLDVSRGRVPKLETLLNLAEKLADLKINELQLYTEHTFAYKKYQTIWKSWGALTAQEIKTLDARCRELGIDLVPNQNSFGHLRYFLADKRLKKLGELSEPYEAETKDFMRRPTTLAPNHPAVLPFIRGLYDELLPNFSSEFFNIGGDETWDLGKGQSKKICVAKGKDRVYLDFIKKLQLEVSARGKTMMLWGDIILKYPKLIGELPKNVVALNWGYEANHPFATEAARFAAAKIPFYVCPGTSTWQTMIGKHDNGLANLRAAARAGKKFGAVGFLNTDWGDGGHPQPLAVSWPMFAAGAALAWNGKSLSETVLAKVLNREIFGDCTNRLAQAGIKLGYVHQKLGVRVVNETPLGTVLAAPKPNDRELFCRNGLNWFAKIPAKKINTALREIVAQRKVLERIKPESAAGKVLRDELALAARMAAQSCCFMLWQQAVAAKKSELAKRLAQQGISELKQLKIDFNAYWPRRNKATSKHCSPFLQWRMEAYQASL